MAARTPRFGMNYFGGDIPGSLSEQGGKFTNADRLLIDRVLSALEYHDHGGGERLGDPTGSPSASLQPGGGTLPGGVTYYYKVSYIDQYGLETAASGEASVVMPSPVAIPAGPGLNTISGGTLDQGTHLYGVTAHDASGETPLSPVSSVTVSDWRTVEVTPTIPTGATEISIWRQGPFDAGFTRLVTQASAAMFVDNGSIQPDPLACDPDRAPPSSNTTGSSGAVNVTAPTGDLVQPTLARRWRIYRTTTAGVYDAESLLTEVTATTVVGGTQLVEEFLDDGTFSLSTGMPLQSSVTLQPSEAISGGGGASGATLLLRSAGGTVWRLTATRKGNIETRLLPLASGLAPFFADEGVGLYDSTGALWRLTVTDAGQVVTTLISSEIPGEIDYQYGQGPELATVDGAVSWLLGIQTDGALTTYGQDDSTVVEGVGVRRLIASNTAPENPQEGDVWLDIS